MKRIFLIFCLGACAALAFAADPALNGNDPVELCLGRELKGNPNLSVTHGKFLYHFANAANLKKFQSNPLRWGIQYGGACGKMGPTSGGGSPGRFAVYGGRIYLFASDACYQWFVLDPERYIDLPDPTPTRNAAAEKAADPILKLAISAIGKPEIVAKIDTLQTKTDYFKASDKDKLYFSAYEAWNAADGYHRKDSYASSGGVTAYFQNSGYSKWSDAVEKFDPQTVDYLRRSASHHPLMLLQASANKKVQTQLIGTLRDQNGTCNIVQFHMNGATTDVAIDSESNLVRWTRFRGRLPYLAGIQRLTLHYSEYKPVDGILFAHKVRIVADGLPISDPLGKIVHVSINNPDAKSLFVMP